MTLPYRLARVCSICLLFFSLTSVAVAQTARVFVSAQRGDDENSCNVISSPCLTFTAALSQADPRGEIIVLDSGDYGAVNITKAVTIDATSAGVVAAIHPRGGDAITVNAGDSAIVILRGLALYAGPQYGINVTSVGSLHIDSCTVTGFQFNGVNFAPRTGNLFVRDSVIRGNDIGLNIRPTGGASFASVERVTLANNRRDGVVVTDGVVGTMTTSSSTGNGGGGIFIATSNNGNTVFNIKDCAVTGNSYIGIQLTRYSPFGSAAARVSGTLISGNRTGLYNRDGTLESFGNNAVRGNATDLDGELISVPLL